jgi:hypothetical protein
MTTPTQRHEHDEDNLPGGATMAQYMRQLKEEGDCNITLTRHELLEMLAEADEAIDGDSNDAEYEALFSLREQLAAMLDDPFRRI